MQKYRIVWTYVANHGTMIVDAASAHDAAKICYNGFSDDFRKRGTIYVFPLDSSKVYSPAELDELKN